MNIEIDDSEISEAFNDLYKVQGAIKAVIGGLCSDYCAFTKGDAIQALMLANDELEVTIDKIDAGILDIRAVKRRLKSINANQA